MSTTIGASTASEARSLEWAHIAMTLGSALIKLTDGRSLFAHECQG